MTASLTFYGYPTSHYCVSAERMLRFKGLRARTVRVPYHDKTELLGATGQDYVPAITMNGRVVRWWEIPDFLERLQPDPTLFPPGREGLARVVADWGHQVLEERVWRYVVTRVPPTFRDKVERWVFEELQTRSRGPFELLKARIPEFRKDLRSHLALVERMLEGHPWLLDEPSLADFAVYGALAPLSVVGEPIEPRFPNVRRWSTAVSNLGPSALSSGSRASGRGEPPPRVSPRRRDS